MRIKVKMKCFLLFFFCFCLLGFRYTANSCPVMHWVVLCLGGDSVPVARWGMLSPLGNIQFSQAAEVKARC